MYWNRYDKATGDTPRIGDRVESCHLGEGSVDGQFRGTFAGWSTINKTSGIVILDDPLETGELAVTMPIVCLRIIKSENTSETKECKNFARNFGIY